MSFAVSYGIRLSAEGNIEVVPVAHIRMRSEVGEVPGIFVIDSGATTSLLPATDAEVLGIELRRGERILVRGVTGHSFVGYRHTVTMVIEGVTLRVVPVIFARGRETPRVLGREGVFSSFGILFDETQRVVGFADAEKEREKIASFFEEQSG